MCAVNATTKATSSPLPLPRLGRETFLHYAARCTRCWPVTMKFFCEWQSGASSNSSSAAQRQQQHGQANAAAEAKAKQKAKQQNNRNAANETVMEENNKTKAPQLRESPLNSERATTTHRRTTAKTQRKRTQIKMREQAKESHAERATAKRKSRE